MANIKISAVDLEINNDILKTYKDYLEQSALGASNPQQLEEIFSRVYGARRIAGSPPLVPDYEVPAEGLIKGLVSNFFAKDADGLLRIEAKFSSREATSNTSTTIGGRVTGAVLPEIRSKRGFKTFAEGQEDNIYNYMNKTLKIGGGTDLFNFLKKQAPIFHNAAYNKAKNLTIFSLKSSTSVRAYQIYFPKASFNSQNFGVSYSSEATSNTITFSYFLRNAFESKDLQVVEHIGRQLGALTDSTFSWAKMYAVGLRQELKGNAKEALMHYLYVDPNKQSKIIQQQVFPLAFALNEYQVGCDTLAVISYHNVRYLPLYADALILLGETDQAIGAYLNYPFLHEDTGAFIGLLRLYVQKGQIEQANRLLELAEQSPKIDQEQLKAFVDTLNQAV
jgi:hypothetical protein